jgi:hypothetical protein
MTFYGIADGSSFEYIVVNIGRLRAFLIETMRRSGAPDFNISDAACRGPVKGAGRGHLYVGTQSGSIWLDGTRKLQQDSSQSSGTSRLPSWVITIRNSGVAGGSATGRGRPAMTRGSWHPRCV